MILNSIVVQTYFNGRQFSFWNLSYSLTVCILYNSWLPLYNTIDPPMNNSEYGYVPMTAPQSLQFTGNYEYMFNKEIL